MGVTVEFFGLEAPKCTAIWGVGVGGGGESSENWRGGFRASGLGPVWVFLYAQVTAFLGYIWPGNGSLTFFWGVLEEVSESHVCGGLGLRGWRFRATAFLTRLKRWPTG